MKVDLPLELIGEILLRLPVKDLLCCKCVCKEWCALIGSRRFIGYHSGHESNPVVRLISSRSLSMSICGDDGSLLPSNYLSHTQMHRCDYLLGPANGVFCAVKHHLHYCVALWNPATRNLKPLPPFPLERLNYLKFGFGIDPFSGDFKVVVLSQRRRHKINFYCVYNSRSDSWSMTEVVGWMKDRVLRMMHRNCVFWKGVCYWPMRNIAILGFDMRKEKFDEILHPDALTRVGLYVHMTAYGDSIALVSHEHYKSQFVDFWVMGRDGLWGERVRIHLPQLNYINSIFAWNKNELLLDTSTQTEAQTTNTLFLCDISTQKLRKLRADFDNSDCYKVYSYMESLFSIKGETDNDNGE